MSSLYSKMQLHERQIRLLYVQSANSLDDPIQCDVKVVDLDDDELEFDALSYVWGDPQATKLIWANRQPCEVTFNLFEALKFLRKKRYDARNSGSSESALDFMVLSRWIWIDAICINQNSILERNAQVTLMRNIYSKATTVHVWLGISDSSIERGLAVFNQIKDLSSTHGGNIRALDISDELVMDKAVAVVSNTSADANIPDVICLLDNPWWRRVWVLQEAILFPSVLVHWHDRVCCFWALVDAAAALKGGIQLAIQRGLVHLQSVLIDLIDSLDATIWKFDSIARLRRNMEASDIDNLVQILSFAGTSEASDDRDRVYGVLGVLPSELDIQPRYDLTLEQALADSFFQLICKTKSLVPILLAIESISIEEYSWVPDLSALSNFSQTQGTSLAVQGKEFLHLNHKFRAAGPDSSCLLEPSSSPTCLKLRGILMDTISVSEPLEAPYNVSAKISWMEVVLDHLNQYLRLAELTEDVLRRSPKATLRFLCTMCLEYDIDVEGGRGAYRLGIEDKRLLLLQWRRLRRKLVPNLTSELLGYKSPELEEAQHSARRIFQSNPDRAIFRTAEGRIGKAPPNVQTGDMIGIFPGSNLPLVLRPVSDERERTFRYVAPCYIYGIMDGQLMAGKQQDELDIVTLV